MHIPFHNWVRYGRAVLLSLSLCENIFELMCMFVTIYPSCALLYIPYGDSLKDKNIGEHK